MNGYRRVILLGTVLALAILLPSLVTLTCLWVFMAYLVLVKEVWRDQIHTDNLKRVMHLYQQSLNYVRVVLYTMFGLGLKWLWCDFEAEQKLAYALTVPFVLMVMLTTKFWHRSIKPLIRRYRFILRTQYHILD